LVFPGAAAISWSNTCHPGAGPRRSGCTICIHGELPKSGTAVRVIDGGWIFGGTTLASSFGDGLSLFRITPDQMRGFADRARIPASPLWKIAVETAERSAESWKAPEHVDALPNDLKDSTGRQILGVAARVK
jgi:hypothetical protein